MGKPFYKIIGNIDKFNVGGSSNELILDLAKNDINNIIESEQDSKYSINEENIDDNKIDQSNILNTGDDVRIKYYEEPRHQNNKSNWFIKALICLVIVFAVLLILAFTLKFALAWKIIFLVIDAGCFIGLIGFINCCKKKSSTGKNSNIYNMYQEFCENNIAENTNNLNRGKSGMPRNGIGEEEDQYL